MTTFNTEFGQFRYTVMPFGAMVAGDVVQQKLNQCFGHIRNVTVTADDIMVTGNNRTTRTMMKHLQPCLKLLESVMLGSTMTSYSTREKRLISLERPILPMVTSQPKVK